MTARAAGYLGLGAAFRASAAAYRAMDVAGKATLDALYWLDGFGRNPISWVFGAVFSDPGVMLDLIKEGLWDPILGDGTFDWQRILTDHPGIIDRLMNTSPGFLTGQGLPAFTNGRGASWLGLLYPDTGGQLIDRGLETSDMFFQTEGSPPPGDLERLMSSLNQRHIASVGDDQGQIDVKAIPQPDGSVKYVVTLPGTKDWQLNPHGDNPYANDLATNLHAMAGDSTVYEQMVAQALREAGAPPGAEVMLVGHSQGGIVAMNAAVHQGASAFPYTVTHVVTAGSPVANIEVPPTTQVLAFENTNDIVPHLDGHTNEDSANITTVSFDNQTGTVEGNHEPNATNYGWAAQQADASNDPSIRAFVDSASEYFSGVGEPTTHVYQVTRE